MIKNIEYHILTEILNIVKHIQLILLFQLNFKIKN